MFKKAFSKARIASALLAAAILIGNTPIDQTTAYAESAPVETEAPAPAPEEIVPEAEETTPEAEVTTPEEEETTPEAEETTPEAEVTTPEEEETTPAPEGFEEIPKYDDSLIQTYADTDPFTYEANSTGVTITKYNGTDSVVTIPSTYANKKVTAIGYKAFENCTNLKSVTVSSNVTLIGHSAFYNCKSLTSITIPNSVTRIGDFAFYGCTSLTRITIPNGVTSIGAYTFYGCTSLASITIPDSVTEIGNLAFCNCESLTSIAIPNSVTSIGASAFCNCESLTSITIPNNVTSIGTAAFAGCVSLASITISNSVTTIAPDAFGDCESLASITIPDSVKLIDYGAFCYCESLTSVTIPNSVTSIGDGAFFRCSRLASITIPNSVTSIGKDAFSGCTNLTVYGYAGSTAETYAKNNSIPFVVLNTQPPALPAITVKPGSGQATVTWNAVSGAAKYRIFTYLNGKYTQVGETTSTSYVVSGLSNGTKYGFLVLAYNGFNWSKYTVNNVVYATTTASAGISLPSITVTPAKNQATVKWNAVSGARKYRIFTYLNGKYTSVGETTSTSYVILGLSGGTKYGFLVLAYDGSIWSSYNTALDVVYATPSGLAKPAFTVTPGKNQATVKWNAVSGAKKYRLFTYLDGKYTQAGETTSTSYVVAGLFGRVKYGFLVLANDGSAWSPYNTALDVVYATPSGLTKPVFTVTSGKNQATVKWNAVSGAKKYRLFTYLNGKYTSVGETTSTSYVISGLSSGVKYGFLVIAYDGSAWSPYNTALDVVYATPTGLTKPVFTVTSGKNQATVKWNAVSGAKKYRIFTYLNGKYTSVGETTSTSHVITGLSGGTRYGFLVLAYDGSSWSPYNTTLDVVYATPSK